MRFASDGRPPSNIRAAPLCLKRLVADLSLEKQILKDVAAGNL
jgi:hypothetical protein